MRNTISASNEYGVVGLIDDSDNNLITGGTIADSSDNLIYLTHDSGDGVHNNIFANVSLYNATKHAIKVYHSDTSSNIFKNITITNSTLAAIDISYAKDTDLLNITFTDTPWDVYVYTPTDDAVTEYDLDNFSLEWANEYGGIKFINTTMNASGANMSKVIAVSSNNAFVNSTLDDSFNQSANITLNNIDMPEPRVIVDFDDDGSFEYCDSSICNNISYDSTNDIFIFNVTHFTAYRAYNLPVVTLVSPEDGNNTVNRTPFLNWTATDYSGDGLTYEINITCHDSCPTDDDRYNTSITTMNFTPAVELLYLWDEGYWYNWSVRAYDSINYSSWTSPWNFTISSLVMISLDPNSSDFGTAEPGDSNSTVNDEPAPIVIHNDGNCYINITLNATNYLWDLIQEPNSSFMFKMDNVSGEEGAFNLSGSIVSWTPINISLNNLTIVHYLNYTEGMDSVEFDLNITVPQSEPAGTKQANFTIYAHYVG